MPSIPLSAQAGSLLLLSGAVLAQPQPVMGGLNDAINSVCGQFMMLLPPLSILLVVLAAVFYGSGKLMPNAEFSNKATNMAAGALVGAVMCLIIVLLVPTIIQSLTNGPVSCGTQTWG
ncbi:Uncharacterised protein [uncultured archaeon]|nr:Uncharacterised protein [uncultured archaeon]